MRMNSTRSSRARDRILVLAVFVVGAAAFVACNDRQAKAPVDQGQGATDETPANLGLSQFAGRGKLCGAQVVVDHLEGPRIRPSISLAVCGEAAQGAGAWMALAATYHAQTATATSADGQETSGTLEVDASGAVSLVDEGGAKIAIGKVDPVEEGMLIEIAPGVTPQLLVGDAPFDLDKDRRDAPDMSLRFAVP
jgi:hypothetical protein